MSVGSGSDQRLDDISGLAENVESKIAKAFQTDPEEPLIKGNISLFVFEKRYDFSEFGKMVVRRDFPKEISDYWDFSTTDAYVTTLMTRNEIPEQITAPLARQIASVYIASLSPDVPPLVRRRDRLLGCQKSLPTRRTIQNAGHRR